MKTLGRIQKERKTGGKTWEEKGQLSRTQKGTVNTTIEDHLIY